MRTIGHINLTVDYWPECARQGAYGRWHYWVGQCRETGTAICAGSLPEAQEALIEAIGLHLNALEEVGERERFFRENGIRMVGAENQAEGCRPETVGEKSE